MQFANPTPTVVKFKRLSTTAVIPKYTRENDACLDLYCAQETTLLCGETKIIPTDLAIELPKGFEARVRGRSGLASKGFHVHHGTIDEEYRGNVGIIMTNTNGTTGAHTFKVGDRIAQFSIAPVFPIIVLETEELSDTNRGTDGFGSSDKVVA